EVLAAARPHVEYVGVVGKCETAVRRGDADVAGPVVPRAPVAGRGVEAVRVSAGRREDRVLRIAVGRCRGVAEVCGGVDRLLAELRLRRLTRRGGGVVVPDAG